MIKEEPLVSIIVPIYKAQKTICRCVNSLIGQTYSNIEIILVENEPSNNNPVYKTFSDKRIIFANCFQKGVSKARNVGLSIAHGDYIAFCDSDDYYDTNYVKSFVNAAIIHNADITISGYYLEKNGEFIKKVLSKSHYLQKKNMLNNMILNDNIMGFCWNKLFKKSVISNSKFPEDITILEDMYFMLKILPKTLSIYYLAKPLYYYCCNPNSAVRSINSLFSRDGKDFLYIKSFNRILQDFSLSNDDSKLVRIKIFENAVIAKYLIVSGKYHNKNALKDVKKEIKQNKVVYFSNSNISKISKLKVLVILYLPWIKILKERL